MNQEKFAKEMVTPSQKYVLNEFGIRFSKAVEACKNTIFVSSRNLIATFLLKHSVILTGNKTEVTSVKLVLFKSAMLFEILTKVEKN